MNKRKGQEIRDEAGARAFAEAFAGFVAAQIAQEPGAHLLLGRVLTHGILLGIYAPEWAEKLLHLMGPPSNPERPWVDQVRDLVADWPVVLSDGPRAAPSVPKPDRGDQRDGGG